MVTMVACQIFLWNAFCRWERRSMDFDYTKYLGPDYKKKNEGKNASTIVANHMSWMDAFILTLIYQPSFCPMDGLRKTPGVGTVAQALNCVFIPRGSDAAVREKTLNIIKER